MEKYGHGTPDDWIERNVYTRVSGNGPDPDAGHQHSRCSASSASRSGRCRWSGSRSGPPASSTASATSGATAISNRDDTSTNIMPWGIIIGGEELHNNHHAYPSSAQVRAAQVRVRHRLGADPRASKRSAWPRCCASRRRWICARTCTCPTPKPSRPLLAHRFQVMTRLFPRRHRTDAARGSRQDRRRHQGAAAPAAQGARQRRPLARRRLARTPGCVGRKASDAAHRLRIPHAPAELTEATAATAKRCSTASSSGATKRRPPASARWRNLPSA